MKIRAFLTLVVVVVAVSTASAQFTLTGDVLNDFPASTLLPDPNGMDVGVPIQLAGVTSGWDMNNVAIVYDDLTDTLFYGLDTFVIGGDADGDGNPGGTSAPLAGNGGTDQPDFMGTESFTFALDLDNDGTLDVIAGLPIGTDINTGYTVSMFNAFPGAIFTPFLAFGAPLPMNTGSVFASPSASQPDVEGSITNFSSLVAMFHQPGQTNVGIHAFMGSQEDDGIGEDYFPGTMTLSIPIDTIVCYPAPNNFAFVDMTPIMGGTNLVFSYGSPAGYGCCAFASPDFDATGKTLPVPGSPILNLGLPNDISTVLAADFGNQNVPGRAVTCKEFGGPFVGLPTGRAIYFQMLGYPINFGSGPIVTSNVLTFIAP